MSVVVPRPAVPDVQLDSLRRVLAEQGGVCDFSQLPALLALSWGETARLVRAAQAAGLVRWMPADGDGDDSRVELVMSV